jgi:two-component system chemotaxis response regulator CheY
MFPSDTKFLIVDDFTAMRKIIKKVLVEMGYAHVQEADDGTSALESLKKAQTEGQPFQVVISDWGMPKMSGIDLLRACKADSRFQFLPFILITAESEQKHILEAGKAGVSEYVVKPFNAITLKEKLEKVYARHFNTRTAV